MARTGARELHGAALVAQDRAVSLEEAGMLGKAGVLYEHAATCEWLAYETAAAERRVFRGHLGEAAIKLFVRAGLRGAAESFAAQFCADVWVPEVMKARVRKHLAAGRG